MELQTTPQLQLAHDFVEYTGKHLFLTGKAGTGKTTFLKTLKEKSPKRMIVVAPTGVAAINAGGVTIHSFFQISFGPQIGLESNSEDKQRYNKTKINIIRSLDLLVIDEISMVRADLLDAIDKVLRRFRDRSKPFGGVQLLMIGDLQQLAPVVKEDEWSMLRAHYDTQFFFSSKALRETSFVSIELSHIFRQQDDKFITLLNKVRENNIDLESLQELNKRHIPNFDPSTDEGYITLCTHNAQAQRLNERKLQQLTGKSSRFTAVVQGKFPEYSYPTDYELSLKEEAQVMFVKNDLSQDKLFYNGKIGKITRIDGDIIYVQCPDDYQEIPVEPLLWDNVKYTIDPDTNEIKEELEGTFTQYPLKLAWAITIHKSQGLTFERAIIDAESSFAHGQVYVALSRCKTIEGMVLSSPISNRSIINDGTVNGFVNQIEENQPNDQWLTTAKEAYQQELLADLFRFNRARYLVNNLNKILQDNTASVPAMLVEHFKQLFVMVEADLVKIAQNFHNQIVQLLPQQADIEKNTALQERIIKASQYFEDKVNTLLIQGASGIDIEVDNKATRKQIKEAISRILEEAQIKINCLAACKNGFIVKTFLDARAKAVIVKSKSTKDAKFSEVKSKDIPHPILYNTLRSWRTYKADELNVRPYLIFSQKALIELVNYLPTDSKTLKQINGMGAKKVSQYGAEIIELIAEFCADNNIEKQEIALKATPKKKEKGNTPKVDTKKISFDLFKEGKKILDIAEERNITVTTVENHIAHYIGIGELDISLFITDDKLSKICAYFDKAESRSLSPARQELGDNYSYTELKFAIKHLDFLADTKSN